MTCKKGYDIVVCQSTAGYYLGTKDKEGMPNCRLTAYASTKEQASGMPLIRQFYCVENEYCNGGTGCFSPE